jgi:hypothetical protein
MGQQEQELENYKKTLQNLDWGYQYADDHRSYKEGQRKFSDAMSLRQSLCLKYPEERYNILKLWEDRGIE